MKPGSVAKVFVSPIIAPVQYMSTYVLKMRKRVNSLQSARILYVTSKPEMY